MHPSEVISTAKIKFLVVGLMVSSEFQQCQFIVNKLHTYYPDKYERPEIRAMLNVDWSEHLTKIRRQYGGDLWRLRVPVAVFVDGQFLGDNTTLINYVSSTYTISLHADFEQLGETQLIEHFRKVAGLGRDFVSIAITKNGLKIGVLLVMLYTDLVPKTCQFFLSRCSKGLWNGSHVIRVVKRSWIQFRGAQAQRIIMPCENYAIPHDRRGVLSMCNFRRHMLNSTDFHISLDVTPWMDYKYVGFGLVVQGEEVLAALEDTPVDHEVPTNALEICDTQQFVVDTPPRPDPELLKDPTEDTGTHKKHGRGGKIVEDVVSILDEGKFREGLYCKESDLVSHMPFVHLPERLLAYLKSQEEPVEEEHLSVRIDDTPSSYSASSLSSSDCVVNRSKGFLARSREDLQTLVKSDIPSDLTEYTLDHTKTISMSLSVASENLDGPPIRVADSAVSEKLPNKLTEPLRDADRTFDDVNIKQPFYKKEK